MEALEYKSGTKSINLCMKTNFLYYICRNINESRESASKYFNIYL